MQYWIYETVENLVPFVYLQVVDMVPYMLVTPTLEVLPSGGRRHLLDHLSMHLFKTYNTFHKIFKQNFIY